MMLKTNAELIALVAIFIPFNENDTFVFDTELRIFGAVQTKT